MSTSSLHWTLVTSEWRQRVYVAFLRHMTAFSFKTVIVLIFKLLPEYSYPRVKPNQNLKKKSLLLKQGFFVYERSIQGTFIQRQCSSFVKKITGQAKDKIDNYHRILMMVKTRKNSSILSHLNIYRGKEHPIYSRV